LAAGLRPSVIAGFFGALLLGILLSIAFTQGLQTLASALFIGAFVLALLLRVYRAEYLMGFVLGMTFTFGAVLPTLIGSIIAAVSAMVHLGIRPLLARLWSKLGNKGSVTTRKA
jgi:Ca2+/Na+ antiporter